MANYSIKYESEKENLQRWFSAMMSTIVCIAASSIVAQSHAPCRYVEEVGSYAEPNNSTSLTKLTILQRETIETKERKHEIYQPRISWPVGHGNFCHLELCRRVDGRASPWLE